MKLNQHSGEVPRLWTKDANFGCKCCQTKLIHHLTTQTKLFLSAWFSRTMHICEFRIVVVLYTVHLLAGKWPCLFRYTVLYAVS